MTNHKFKIEYAFSLNNYFKKFFDDKNNKKYQNLKFLLNKHNIPVFFALDDNNNLSDTYFIQIMNWVIQK